MILIQYNICAFNYDLQFDVLIRVNIFTDVNALDRRQIQKQV